MAKHRDLTEHEESLLDEHFVAKYPRLIIAESGLESNPYWLHTLGEITVTPPGKVFQYDRNKKANTPNTETIIEVASCPDDPEEWRLVPESMQNECIQLSKEIASREAELSELHQRMSNLLAKAFDSAQNIPGALSEQIRSEKETFRKAMLGESTASIRQVKPGLK